MEQLMDAPCVTPSNVTQKIFAVLVQWYHHIVLTLSFKLVSFLHLSQVSKIGVQALPLCYTSFTLNLWRNVDASVDWLYCIKFWTNMWRCRWISWIWFCVIDLTEELLLNKDLRYLVVLQLCFRNPLLQKLLLSGTHYQTPSPRWLR